MESQKMHLAFELEAAKTQIAQLTRERDVARRALQSLQRRPEVQRMTMASRSSRPCDPSTSDAEPLSKKACGSHRPSG